MKRTIAKTTGCGCSFACISFVGTRYALTESMLSPEIEQTAATLDCRINGTQPAIFRQGRQIFPAHVLFTIHAPESPAVGATFSVAEPILSAAILREKFEQTTANFQRFAK